MVILTLLPSATKGGGRGLALETVAITIILAQDAQNSAYSLELHCYTAHVVTLCTHFYCTFWVIKKQLHLTS